MFVRYPLGFWPGGIHPSIRVNGCTHPPGCSTWNPPPIYSDERMDPLRGRSPGRVGVLGPQIFLAKKPLGNKGLSTGYPR